mgnify:FL=1
MKFTQIPTDTFKNLQLNAGILVKNFAPTTGNVTPSDIIGATSGGISFEATPTFSDYGDDIDNCPKNMKELKKLDSWEAKLSGTFVSVNTELSKTLIGAADVDTEDATHVVPRNSLSDADFETIWWVGDYSELNGAKNGGYCAIQLKNALSTGGFKIQTGDKAKGTFSFEFLGHYSIDAQDEVPFDIYIKAGTAEAG